MNARSFGIRGRATRPAWALAVLVATTAWGEGTENAGTICASGYKMSGRASREWMLELSRGGGVFHRQGKSELLQSLSGSEARPDSQVYKTESGELLTVRWDRSACRDARDESKVFVSVEFEGTLYQGCGKVGDELPQERAASRSPA